MGATAVVEYETSVDSFGKTTYATRDTYACYPVETRVVAVNDLGREDISTVALYTDGTDIQPTDRVTYSGVVYRMVALETWRDADNAIWGQVMRLAR